MILKVKSCAVAGRPGLSAYQIAVLDGYTGSEEEWLASLKGEKGDAGTNGQDGTDGKDANIWFSNNPAIYGNPYSYFLLSNLYGVSGASVRTGEMIIENTGGFAYGIVAVDSTKAYVGTGTRLRGFDGQDGADGQDGQDGAPGRNAVIWHINDQITSWGSDAPYVSTNTLEGLEGATPSPGDLVVNAYDGCAYWIARVESEGAILVMYKFRVQLREV